mmetsp:Transcript_2835/g.6691  ORF Transcript_2835/g.6691 Transcript_2835/m.6691 type:complete len:292 (+) Transcript_2835:2241-3116(+)
MQPSQHDSCRRINESRMLAEVVHESDLVPHFVPELLSTILCHTLRQCDGGHPSRLGTDHHLVLRHQISSVTNKLRNQGRLAASRIPRDHRHPISPHSRADKLPLFVSWQGLRELGHRGLACKPPCLILELLVLIRSRHEDCSFRPKTPLIVSRCCRSGCCWCRCSTLAVSALCLRSLRRSPLALSRRNRARLQLHLDRWGVVPVLLLQFFQDAKEIYHAKLDLQWLILEEIPQPLEWQSNSINNVSRGSFGQFLHLIHHILDVLIQLLWGRQPPRLHQSADMGLDCIDVPR